MRILGILLIINKNKNKNKNMTFKKETIDIVRTLSKNMTRQNIAKEIKMSIVTLFRIMRE